MCDWHDEWWPEYPKNVRAVLCNDCADIFFDKCYWSLEYRKW